MEVTRDFKPLDPYHFSEPCGAAVIPAQNGGEIQYDRSAARKIYDFELNCIGVAVRTKPGSLVAFWRYNKTRKARVTQVMYVQSNGHLRFVPKGSPLLTVEGLEAENAYWNI